jgi:uncharacterized protein (TIGR02996 family)
MPTDHPEYVALLRAIVADPWDDTPRLVAADWLDEHDQPHRAAFIRVQVELARLRAAGLDDTPAADAHRRKQREFVGALAIDSILWAAEECPELVHVSSESLRVEGADRVTFRRGFIEEVRCSVGEWRQHGAAVRDRQPVRVVFLSGCDEATRDDWYALFSALMGLEEVGLDADTPGLVEWLRAWLPGTQVYANPGAT